MSPRSGLQILPEARAAIAGHAYDCLPEEACGLLAGDLDAATVSKFYPCRNAAESSRVYTLDPMDYMRAESDADDRGLDVVGVVHSHTHTDPYPSTTDVDQAPVPEWHYVIVSLRDTAPMMRSYRILDGQIAEEPISG